MPAERSPDAPPERGRRSSAAEKAPNASPLDAPDTAPDAAVPPAEPSAPAKAGEQADDAAKASAPPQAPAAEAPAKQPYEWVRTLESVQNQIIGGNRGAHIIQRQLITDIGGELAKVPDSMWKEPRNARAVITYVLSGGDPRALVKLMKQGEAVTGISDTLLKGLYAYARGRNKEAIDILETVSARTFDPGPGGHLALAQATLMADRNAAKALEYLDEARLLGPGTLVEEAALRRAAPIAQSAQDFDKLIQIMSLYMRRFHQSVYASTFRWSFSKGFAASKFARDDTFLKRLTSEIDTFSKEQSRTAYVSLAEESLVQGKLELALLSAQKIAAISKENAAFMQKAQLYEASVLVFSDEYDHAVATLNAMDPAKLSRRDRDILKAALIVTKRLREPVAENAADTVQPASATQGKDAQMVEVSPVVKAGRAAIATANGLLNGTRP